MTPEALATTIQEARRFIERAQALQSALLKPENKYGPLPERSAARRSSLDLTRALARLRRG